MEQPSLPQNFFAAIPAEFRDEVFETVAQSDSVRIERILSKGHCSPEGYWYDQDEDEWVLVLQGAATLEFADGSSRELGVGDSVNLPAHTKHRVLRTTAEEVTIWLAVFSKGYSADGQLP